MKKSITVLVLMVSITAFSQQLIYKTGGEVYSSDNMIFSPEGGTGTDGKQQRSFVPL